MHNVIHFMTTIAIAVLVHEVVKKERCWTLSPQSQDSSRVGKQSSLPYKGIRTPPGPGEGMPPKLFEEREITGGTTSTSVWCYGNSSSDRFCKFHNLCYHPNAESFVFFFGEETVMENLRKSDLERPILDLSTVAHHNSYFFTLISLPGKVKQKFSPKWVTRTTLAFSRFKPDNLMHVLHDDIIPLHHTLSMISNAVQETGRYDVQLVFLEGWEAGEYISFYEALSNHQPLLRQDLNDVSDLVCFENIHIGILKSTVWYQYGFFQPQGPVAKSRVTASHIHQTSRDLQSQLPPQTDEGSLRFLPNYVVLLCRTENRLIINEAELSEEIAKVVKTPVIHVSTDRYSVSDMIHLVSKSKGIVGMHGALMSLALFLSPGSFVLELFPFGVNPDHYTPYRTLSLLPGMGVAYQAWRNVHADKTLSYPDRPAELGGIRHLTSEEQARILSEEEVGRHLCCDDPSWLLHIYQDTVVDIKEVAHILISLKHEIDQFELERSGNLEVLDIFPSKVRNVQCVQQLSDEGEITLVVLWQEPWNVGYVTAHKVHYEVLVKTENSDDHIKYLVSERRLSLTVSELNGKYIVWICAVFDDKNRGPYTNVMDCGS